jgi:hypothetical protein
MVWHLEGSHHRPLLFNEHVHGDACLRMLKEEAFARVLNKDGEFPAWFQQDGVPAHYSIRVREFLGHWNGQREARISRH